MAGAASNSRTRPNAQEKITAEARRHARVGIFWAPYDRLEWPTGTADRDAAQAAYLETYWAHLKAAHRDNR
jgi:hypothetical protein